MKGVVFAAGLGTRLRPLSDILPKPLAPVGPWPLVRYAVETLKAAGITEIAMNTFHLGEQLPWALGDGSAWGVKIHWSHENEGPGSAILGTGGGLRKLRAFLGDEPFVVMNGDTLIDFDVRRAVEEHARTGAIATMVLKDDPRVTTFGAIGYEPSGRVRDFVGRVPIPADALPLKQALFTGVHVLSPKVFDFIAPSGEVNLGTQTYPAMIAAGSRVSSVLQEGYWSDLGTADRLLEAGIEVLSRNATFSRFDPMAGLDESTPGIFFGANVAREMGVRLVRPALIGAGSTIGRDASIGPGAVLGKNVTVAAGARLSRALVLDGAAVEGDVHAAIVTRDSIIPVK